MIEISAGAARVHVELGQRSYDVLIGPRLIAEAGPLIATHCPTARAVIITDSNVAQHHLARLEFSLGSMSAGSIILEPGEATKNFTNLATVAEKLLSHGIERGDLVIALGGGVIGDLAGFSAAILRRGVRFVQLPTSLLAQVDSSVGGKTGINTRQGKNLIGAFHQPSLVLADTDVLSTLPSRQMRAGYAEVVKYGLLGDRGFYETLERDWRGIFGNDPAILLSAIEKSIAAKAAIVARDETETGDRMLLNLGHTFGHALEAWAGYSDRLFHGEAIAIGLAQAFRFSAAQGYCSTTAALRVEKHLRATGLPTRIADISGAARPTVDELMQLMAQDKKVQRGKLTFILVRDIGQAFVARDVQSDQIRAFLAAELSTGTTTTS